MDRGVVERPVRKGSRDEETADALVVEEPLEIRIAGDTLAITMRTPGDDHDLALGFLFSEGVIDSVADVGTIAHCGRPGEEGYGNAIDVTPGPGVVLDPERTGLARRGTLTTAACGVCGRRSIDDLLERITPVEGGPVIASDVLGACDEQLREAQPRFTRTGGIHAAAALAPDGSMLVVAEDVGRHNAVDKVLGALLRAERTPAILVVSGRASFEIVQKAAVARIPIVAAVSAPTSLAVDLAVSARITLAGFVRGGSYNLYSHPERIA